MSFKNHSDLPEYAMNIREQKEAADALRIAALVSEHSSEAMMVTDTSNRILSINRLSPASQAMVSMKWPAGIRSA